MSEICQKKGRGGGGSEIRHGRVLDMRDGGVAAVG